MPTGRQIKDAGNYSDGMAQMVGALCDGGCCNDAPVVLDKAVTVKEAAEG